MRPPYEKLGLIGFDANPLAYVTPTTNIGQIATALAGTPSTGRGSNPPAAIALALRQLATARVSLGAIVVVSDGKAIKLGTGGPTPQAVKAAAAAANRPVITLGLKDAAATPASLRALAQAAPGAYETVTPAQLPAAMLSIQQQLSSNYVVRYRSHAPVRKAGRRVGDRRRNRRVGTCRLPLTGAAPGAAPASDFEAGASPLRTDLRRQHAALADAELCERHAHSASRPPALASGPHRAGSPSSPDSVPSCSWARLPWRCTARPRTRFACGSRHSSRSRTKLPLTQPRASAGTGFFSSLQRGSWWPPFVAEVEISGSPHSPVYLVKRAAAIGLVVALLVTVVSGSVLIGLVPLLAWPYLLKKGVDRGARKQRTKFADTLPSYLQDMASAIRVGRSFAGAVAVVADSADEPTRSQLERAATDEALGLPLEETLQAVSDRMHSNDMDQVALIAGVHRRTGSNISEALDRVAEGARERADLRREMRALTSQAKMSSSVLTGLPVVLLLGLTVLSPSYAHPLLHTTLGLIALGIGGVMIFGGWKVMGKITRIRV